MYLEHGKQPERLLLDLRNDWLIKNILSKVYFLEFKIIKICKFV